MNALPSPPPVFANMWKACSVCLFLFTRESVAQMSGHHAFCTYSILWTRVILQSVVSTITEQVLVKDIRKYTSYDVEELLS